MSAPTPPRGVLREDRPSTPGEGDEGQRTRFERDRDAIIYTSAFRRLAGVTQVISPGEGLVLHNRLTHTLEVAQIALRLAQNLSKRFSAECEAFGGLDPSLVEAAALAHDLGHPPFGHIAEKTLNRLIVKAGLIDGYEGNAQAFRIVTKLAARDPRIEGLNLTRATLNAILKYPRVQRERLEKVGPEIHQAEKKWGAYSSEQFYLNFARELQKPGREKERCLEAQIMDWADDIAYSVSDTEDFFRAGMIPLDRIFAGEESADQFVDAVFNRWEEQKITDEVRGDFALDDLRKAFVKMRRELPSFEAPYDDCRDHRVRLRAFTSQLIGRYIQGTKISHPQSGKADYLDIDVKFRMEVRMLKELTWQYVIKNSALAGQQYGHQRVVTKLFEIYGEAIASSDPDDWDILPARDRDALRWLARSGSGALPDKDVIRLAADAIAGMTDQQALRMYQRLTGVSPGGAFETWAR
jgi:dGTPase